MERTVSRVNGQNHLGNIIFAGPCDGILWASWWCKTVLFVGWLHDRMTRTTLYIKKYKMLLFNKSCLYMRDSPIRRLRFCKPMFHMSKITLSCISCDLSRTSIWIGPTIWTNRRVSCSYFKELFDFEAASRLKFTLYKSSLSASAASSNWLKWGNRVVLNLLDLSRSLVALAGKIWSAESSESLAQCEFTKCEKFS